MRRRGLRLLGCGRKGAGPPRIYSLVLLTSAAAIAADSPVYPPVGANKVSSYGSFSYSSSASQYSDGYYTIEYSVCNLDSTAPLIYRWDGPNIYFGAGGRLPVSLCDIFTVPASSIELYGGATIVFSQSAQSQAAPAYVPRLSLPLPLPLDLFPPFVINRLRAWYLPTPKTPTPADFEIVPIREKEGIRHIISWYPPHVRIVIGLAAFGGQDAKSIIGSIGAAGYSASTTTFDEASLGMARDFAQQERLSSPVIFIQKTSDSKKPLEFFTSAHPDALTQSRVTLIDMEEKSLIGDFGVTVFGK